MKSLVLALALFVSTNVFARQYFQCSIPSPEYSDVSVINLQTENGGTLFISSGMQNPEDERFLMDISLEKVSEGNHVYKVVDDRFDGYVAIPSSVIGKSTDAVSVNISLAGGSATFSCFARIYND